MGSPDLPRGPASWGQELSPEHGHRTRGALWAGASPSPHRTSRGSLWLLCSPPLLHSSLHRLPALRGPATPPLMAGAASGPGLRGSEHLSGSDGGRRWDTADRTARESAQGGSVSGSDPRVGLHRVEKGTPEVRPGTVCTPGCRRGWGRRCVWSHGPYGRHWPRWR